MASLRGRERRAVKSTPRRKKPVHIEREAKYDGEGDEGDFEDDVPKPGALFNELLEGLLNKRASLRTAALEKMIAFLSGRAGEITDVQLLTETLLASTRNSGQETQLACRCLAILGIELAGDRSAGAGARTGPGRISSPAAAELYHAAEATLKALIANTSRSPVDRGAACTALAALALVGAFADAEINSVLSTFADVMKKKNGSGELLAKAVDAWCLLASSQGVERLATVQCTRMLPALEPLLDHDVVQVRLSAGVAIALLWSSWLRSDAKRLEEEAAEEAADRKERKQAEKRAAAGPSAVLRSHSLDSVEMRAAEAAAAASPSPQPRSPGSQSPFARLQQIRARLEDRLGELATDSDRSLSRADRAAQHSLFRAVVGTFEEGEEPSETLRIDDAKLEFAGWIPVIQLNAIRSLLASGLQTHLRENEFLTDLFSLALAEADAGEGSSHRERHRASDKEIARQRSRKHAARFEYEEADL